MTFITIIIMSYSLALGYKEVNFKKMVRYVLNTPKNILKMILFYVGIPETYWNL